MSPEAAPAGPPRPGPGLLGPRRVGLRPAGDRRHLADRAAEVTEQAGVVGALVQQEAPGRAATAAPPVPQPHSVQGERAGGPQREHVADRSRGHRVPGRPYRVDVRVVLGDGGHPPGRGGGAPDALALGQRGGQRLLDQHVPAAGEGVAGGVRVRGVRGPDVRGVDDHPVVHRRLHRGVSRHREGTGHRPAPLGLRVDRRHQPEAAGGVGVHVPGHQFADRPASHQGDADRV